MNEVNRKQNKPFKRRYKIVLAFAVLLALIAIWRLSQPLPLPKVEPKPDKLILSAFALEEIEMVTLYPSGGEAFSLHKSVDNVYAVVGDEHFPLNADRVEEIFDMATLMRAEYTAATDINKTNLHEFGITDDSFHFTIHAKNGVTETWFTAEDVHADETNRFLYREGDTTVYLTDLNYIGAMDYTQEELHPIPAVNFTPGLVDGISVRYRSGDQVAFTNKQGIWLIAQPFRYPASAALQDLLGKIGNMRLSTFVAEGNEDNLPLYGLDAPSANVTIQMAPSVISILNPGYETIEQRDVPRHSVTFLFGDAFSSVGYYCLFENTIYKATSLSMGFLLDMDPNDWVLQTPFDIPLNTMQSISVMRGSTQTDYSIELSERVLPNNVIAVDENGNTIFDMHVSKDGEEIPAEPFMRAYLEMMLLTASGNAAEVDPQTDTVLMKVHLKFDAGERTISFFPYDALHAALSIDGVIRHYVDLSQLDLITI